MAEVLVVGGHTEPVGNNLSFPVLAADGFTITPLANPTFTSAYTGPFTGLTGEDLGVLEGYGWYAQKVEGISGKLISILYLRVNKLMLLLWIGEML
ncbi:MAG: hypothetical protein MZV64_51275 [Ignavibacteriales bacterium]|nr:hypothetical protein [Ignavibacteriales bacterium]